ncbi:AI-2E family transporter [Candidatus Magnetaquicoccus inordinatus]|uniref:AI-2E family transporter n=1 Tax=Candidatus Magnetaquicoccus inordinatus TaxID=2496818 RepID=UPI00187D44A9|nr:AI-2E family transporter [Candidatus Magnetaquicoccus inordinatus]
MENPFSLWLRRLHDPQIAGLMLVLVTGGLLIYLFGHALAPYLTALVIAYLLEGIIRALRRLHCPRILAVWLVFGLFLLMLNLLLFVLLPHLIVELARISEEIPRITTTIKQLSHQLTESAAGLFNPEQVESMLLHLVENSQELLGKSVTFLLRGVPGLISLTLYLLLVPFLVFFFMKDKEPLLAAFSRYLPGERALLERVLHEVNAGVGGYIHGKFWEMLLLAITSYIGFALIDFRYAFVVGLLTGLSVLIPFLGLAVVTIPVVLLGIFQWGASWEALHPLLIYGILQLVDGNIVAPLILGETVRIHPTTIMLAVLLFGSLWGVVGVFFAVPLVVLLKSVLEVLIPQQPITPESTD